MYQYHSPSSIHIKESNKEPLFSKLKLWLIVGFLVPPLISFTSGYTFVKLKRNSVSDYDGDDKLLQYTSTIVDENTHYRDGLEINVYNEYTIDDPYSGQYTWDIIVEPYRPTYFDILNANIDYTYIWYIDTFHQQENITMVTNFYSPGSQHVILCEVYNLDDSLLQTIEFKVREKYIRREIRTLNNMEIELFYQAVHIMNTVPTTVGQILYGYHYYSTDYFSRLHLYMTSDESCDHWNNGPGYIMSYMALTYMYEKSLQAINPSITIPYWDYTLESTFYTTSHSFRKSKLFSPSQFGSACDSEDVNLDDDDEVTSTSTSTSTSSDSYYCISNTSDRFRNVTILSNASQYSDILNTHDILRSPWNSNDVLSITRSSYVMNIPNKWKPCGCSELSNILQFNSFSEIWLSYSEFANRFVFDAIGGHWVDIDDEDDDGDDNNGDDDVTASSNKAFHLRTVNKSLKATSSYDYDISVAYRKDFAHQLRNYTQIFYRQKYLSCTNADSVSGGSTSSSFTSCSCDANDTANAREILYLTGILDSLVYHDYAGYPISSFLDTSSGEAVYSVNDMNVTETTRLYKEIFAYICTTSKLGDVNDGNAPSDPLFWVIAANLERVWHLKALNYLQDENSFDYTWPITGYNTSCSGHRALDGTPFTAYIFNEYAIYYDIDIPVSNDELLHTYLNVTKDDYPYMYDSLEWKHCDLLGGYFNNYSFLLRIQVYIMFIYVYMCYSCLNTCMLLYIYYILLANIFFISILQVGSNTCIYLYLAIFIFISSIIHCRI